MRKLLTIEDFRSCIQGGGETKPEDAIVKREAPGAPEPIENSRRVKFVFSDGSVDRAGDTINPDGWLLDNFNKNPIALFGHDSRNVDSVIGRAVNVATDGNKLVGEIEFAEAEINPNAEKAFRMVKAGLLSAVSVGFLPVEFSWSGDKNRPFGIDFEKQELMEISVVPVPCNANALIEAGVAIVKAAGIVPIERKRAEEMFRSGKVARRTREEYLAAVAQPKPPPTVVPADFINRTQEEILDAIAAAAAVPVSNDPDAVQRAGRRISAASEAKLKEAMEHHQSATDCIKSVLDSNDPDDDDDDPDNTTGDPDDVHDPVIPPGKESAIKSPAQLRIERSRKILETL